MRSAYVMTTLLLVCCNILICSTDPYLFVQGNQKPFHIQFTELDIENHQFNLFTHGKPGYLLIDGKWKNAEEIVKYLEMEPLEDIQYLNIFGCEFGKGKTGQDAVKYIGLQLGIAVSASDDITGEEGDWDLEVGLKKSFPNLLPGIKRLQTVCQTIHSCTEDIYAYGVENNAQSDNSRTYNTSEYGSLTITYTEGGMFGGTMSNATGTQFITNREYEYTVIQGVTNTISGNQTVQQEPRWRDLVYIKLSFSKPVKLGNSPYLVDLDATTREMATIFGSKRGQPVYPTHLSCLGNVNNHTYDVVTASVRPNRMYDGLTLAPLTSALVKTDLDEPNIEPNREIGHFHVDFGLDSVDAVYFFFGVYTDQGSAPSSNLQTSGISIQCFENVFTVLPIELVEFKATQLNNEIELTWETSSEKDNSHFEIERSFDGQLFEKIAEIQGAGNSSESRRYRYKDGPPFRLQNQIYYRLKYVDYNGDYSYSPIQNVNLKQDNDVFRIYPNPLISTSTLNIEGPSIHNIEIFSMQGHRVMQERVTETNHFQLPIQNLHPGMYLLVVNEKKYAKLVIE